MTIENMEQVEKEEYDLRTIRIDQIFIATRYAKRADGKGIDDLCDSIKTCGLITPIAVMQLDAPFETKGSIREFSLMAGYRRIQSLLKLGSVEVPAHVYPFADSMFHRLQIELAENVQRLDPDWTETLEAKKRLHDLHVAEYGDGSDRTNPKGWSIGDSAKLYGESRATFQRDMEIARAIEKNPELKDKKNKQEVFKVMEKDRESKVMAVLARKQSEVALDIKKQRMIDSYLIGDFTECLKKVPDRSVDFIEFDPPYGIDIDKKKNKSEWCDRKEYMKEYREIEKVDYPDFIRKSLTEFHRVMANDSWLVFWFGITPWYDTILDIAQEIGFRGNGIPCIWNKITPGQTLAPHRVIANTYEPFFYFFKGGAILNKQGRSNVYSCTGVSPDKKTHPTEKPLSLMKEILDTFCAPGARILVPCLGSGVTLRAAYDMGFSGFGYDLSEDFRNKYILKVQGLI